MEVDQEAKNEDEAAKREPIYLPLDWQIPDSVPTHRVTNLAIQIAEDEFTLSFFEQRAPIVTSDYNYEKARQLEGLKALCVARVSISAAKIPGIIDVLKRQHDKYLKIQSTGKEQPEI